jgi:SAM-dependent methyltransferase
MKNMPPSLVKYFFRMKFHSPLFLALLFCLTLSAGCANESSSETPGNGPAKDSSFAHLSEGDTASLDTLLTQYDPPGRVVWQKPEMVIQKLGDLSDKVVADLGAGSGFFSRRLAQSAKKVIAIEVDPRFIAFMDSIKLVELLPKYQRRFETRLATPDNPNLRPGEAGIVLIVNTYIYIQNRVQYMKHLLSVLPEGGKVIIVDFKKKRIPISYPPASIRLELYEVENELLAAGFSGFTSDDCSLDYQYIILAEK